jgi:tetratricopeptide (TPR) repeat protein
LGNGGLRIVCVKESFVHCQEGLSDEEEAVVRLAEALEMLDRGDLDLAIESTRKATLLKPDYREAIYQLGLLLSLAEKPNQALETFEILLSLNPSDSRALNNMGCLLFRMGQIEKAEKLLKEAIQSDRANWEAKKNLADLYLETQRPDKAGEIYSQILEEHRNCPEAMLALAEVFLSSGDCDTAKMLSKIVLRATPGNEKAKQMLKRIREFENQSVEASREMSYATE